MAAPRGLYSIRGPVALQIARMPGEDTDVR
jgi:hypothetical protein